MLEALLKAKTPVSAENVLGFEPVVLQQLLTCSWLCNGLETVAAEALKITPNENGLLRSLAEAQACVAYISRDEVGAEPGLWLPWLMIDHTESACRA